MSVKSRRILLTASDYSEAGPCLAPALRMAIGLACSFKRPRVTIVLHGEAVRSARIIANPAWTHRYQASAKAHSIELLVEKQSLESRGLEASDLVEWTKIVDIKEVSEQWQMADLQVKI